MSTNHCARISCWWVRTCATHLWFVHLPNWHFSLHLTPLQRPGMCAVDNFQRLRFGSLPTSSQERVKQESTFRFTFTFTLHTIYEVNGTDRYLEMCWPVTDNDAIITLYLIHTLSLTLSALYRASTSPVSIMPRGKLYRGADFLRIFSPIILLLLLLWSLIPCFYPCPLLKMRHDASLHPSTHPLIDPSIYPSIYWSIHRYIDRSINPSIESSIHQSIHLSINVSINKLIHWSIHWSINRSIGQFIDW